MRQGGGTTSSSRGRARREEKSGASGEPAESSETEYSEWDRRSGQESGAGGDPGGNRDGTEMRQRIHKTTKQRNQESQLPVVLEANAAWDQKKVRSIRERFFYGNIMIGTFCFIIAMGHLYLSCLVIAITVGIFHEIITLKRNKEKDNKIPWFLTLRWYFFGLGEFYAIKRFLPASTELENRILEYGGRIPYLLFVKYFTFTIYVGFIGGIIFFVLSLRKFTLRYQFNQLGWTLLTVLLIVMQSCAHVSNIYAGLVWFLASTTLVITNDIFAYIVGMRFGRTPLIALSPKKTVEGFFGGFIFTCIWAVFAVNILSRMDFFLCPQPDLVTLPFSGLHRLECDEEWKAAFFKTVRIPFSELEVTMISIHAMVMALFASLVAPFGGFFASGFKRAFRIKDFGDLIPGHGGLTDRMDCLIVMGLFCHVYLNTFVSSNSAVSLEMTKRLAESLTPEDRQKLMSHLLALGRGR
ncbi:unnamed protein product [Amoebophrya sp. A25]|nr:unnamed protein product [Amoebophrya sp. A25]|eukprot:GSA25T00019014001.1